MDTYGEKKLHRNFWEETAEMIIRFGGDGGTTLSKPWQRSELGLALTIGNGM